MKLYKIKHIPTGLYYTPSRSGIGNFSIVGKVYSSLPKIKTDVRVIVKNTKGVKGKYPALIDYFKIKPNKKGYYNYDERIKTKKSEWEIKEITNII